MGLLHFIIILVLLLIIDIPMITIVNKRMYHDAFKKINNNEINTGQDGIIAAIICYLLLSFSIYHFVVSPAIQNNTPNNILVKNGLLLGLFIYGVYNTTNKATINNYSTFVTIADTLWGTLLMGIISALSVSIIKYYKI